MTYDNWKTTDPRDMEDIPQEEEIRLEPGLSVFVTEGDPSIPSRVEICLATLIGVATLEDVKTVRVLQRLESLLYRHRATLDSLKRSTQVFWKESED